VPKFSDIGEENSTTKIMSTQGEGIPMERVTIYFAGPLFTIYERILNRTMAEKLRSKGYIVTLPQDLDMNKNKEGRVDLNSIAEKDREEVLKSDLVVANLDGPDTDSGTALEVGIKIGSGKPVIGWRTDIRGSEWDSKWNAMFNLCDKIIYFPSSEEDIDGLIEEIDKAIREVLEIQ
jgi:nucleoside 2-deoxyribosyltransferase